MKILTWNIQATKGCDSVFDSSRIINEIMRFGPVDVICLQEVARHIPSLGFEDQVTIISNQFPEFDAHWAPGFSVPDKSGTRSEFGNLTLVRKPLLNNARIHTLPSPLIEGLQIPRTMAEVVVGGEQFEFSIFNAHLAFHSSVERIEQLKALTLLRDQIVAKCGLSTNRNATGPFSYADSIQSVILCGDLNVSSESNEFKEHITGRNWVDCWDVQNDTHAIEKTNRQPTCGCYDHIQWTEGPHIRDYFLVTENIADKTISVDVNVETDASDHQPVLLEIAL
ncbi:MAG: endonuclease/exonuclease/phosphatase family metal-dependent hydrolase [Granulosicoccus sp.]